MSLYSALPIRALSASSPPEGEPKRDSVLMGGNEINTISNVRIYIAAHPPTKSVARIWLPLRGGAGHGIGSANKQGSGGIHESLIP